jgi:hypothetical protein
MQSCPSSLPSNKEKLPPANFNSFTSTWRSCHSQTPQLHLQASPQQHSNKTFHKPRRPPPIRKSFQMQSMSLPRTHAHKHPTSSRQAEQAAAARMRQINVRCLLCDTQLAAVAQTLLLARPPHGQTFLGTHSTLTGLH